MHAVRVDEGGREKHHRQKLAVSTVQNADEIGYQCAKSKASRFRGDVKGKIVPVINVISDDFDIDDKADGQADTDEQHNADGQLDDADGDDGAAAGGGAA